MTVTSNKWYDDHAMLPTLSGVRHMHIRVRNHACGQYIAIGLIGYVAICLMSFIDQLRNGT